MRHFVLVVIAAIVIAVALVLVVGEEETAEDTAPVTTRDAGPPPARTEAAPAPEPPASGREAGETARVQRAVELYVEAAETGEVRAPPGLPTSDELSIRAVVVRGNRATVRLAGGPGLLLQREGGRWRVTEVVSVR